MSEYTEKLYEIVNGYEFVRCFHAKCPECGEKVFSIDENIVGNKLKAKFICDCGKKWCETVYSPRLKKYKHQQALVEEIRDQKYGRIKVLKTVDRYYLVTPDKIRSKQIKTMRKETNK